MAFAATAIEGRPLSLRAWLRVAMRLAAILFCMAVCALPVLIGHWAGIPNRWPQRFLIAVRRIAGARLQVAGTPRLRQVLFTANHISWLDITLLANVARPAFVAHDGLATHPVLRWLCRMNDTIFVARGNRMQVDGQVQDLRRALAEHHAVALFPEGTTSDGAGMLPFKSSLLSVLEPPPPGILLQPVVISFGPDTADIAWIGEETLFDNIVRVLARRRGFVARLDFLPPVDPADFAGRKAITAYLQATMQDRQAGSAGRLSNPPGRS